MTEPSPADTWAELLEAIRHPDQEPWAKTLEPAVALAAADPVLSRLFVEATWDEIRLSPTFPVDDDGDLPYLWPEAAGFELRHRTIDAPGAMVVILFRPTDGGPDVPVAGPVPDERWAEAWDDLRRRWDDRALADPRFMVFDPAVTEPLGHGLGPDDAVACWSAAVARALGGGRAAPIDD